MDNRIFGVYKNTKGPINKKLIINTRTEPSSGDFVLTSQNEVERYINQDESMVRGVIIGEEVGLCVGTTTST